MAVIIKKGASPQKLDEKLKANAFSADKFCGKIRSEKNAVDIQKKLRNEWQEPNR